MDIFEIKENIGVASYRVPGDYDFAMISLDDPNNNTFVSEFVLFDSFTIQKSANYQIMPALDSTTYIYTFGSGDGQFSIGGLAFEGPKLCRNGSVIESKGFTQLVEFFERFNINRVETSKRLPRIRVNVLSGPTFSGFLTDYRAQPSSQFKGMVSFSMNFIMLDEVEAFKFDKGFTVSGGSFDESYNFQAHRESVARSE